MCGMCAAHAELENGDPEEPVDFLCHVAHLRALTMGIRGAGARRLRVLRGRFRGMPDLLDSAANAREGARREVAGTRSRPPG